jgi:Zn-dependent protease
VESKYLERRIRMKKLRAGLFALAGKFGAKVVPVLAKLAKGLKVGKVGLAGASLASYAYMFTWEFAAMIMFMLFVHESGHIWAMKRCGVKTKGIYFLPFVGGAAVADDEFPSRGAEVFIAIMGPIWGFALALLTGLVYIVTENPLFAAAAGWMAMVNLFNLLPINPLDGGRIMKSIAYSVHSRVGLVFLVLGLIGSGFLAFKVGFGLFVFLLIVGGLELAFEYKRRTEHPAMNGADIFGSAIAYAAVAGVLWGLMAYMQHIPGAAHAMELLRG